MSVRAQVRKSLLRVITWYGGDRRIVGSAGLVLFLIGYTMFTGLGFFYGLSIILPSGLFLAVLWVAREASKKDPYMVDVMIRANNYRAYYAPKSHIGVEHRQVRDFTK